MTAVDAGFGQTLKAISSVVEVSDAAQEFRWGTDAVATEALSPLATQSDAQAEATRQLQFIGGPCVIEQLSVAGHRRDLIGLPVTIRAERSGYTVGIAVFVIGFDEQEDNRTLLTVLRRL